ncbi:MAG TPA: response regulator [Ruminiclostridium sp.]
MYKLMIVDDEFNIRDGLANTTPWDNIDVKVVGTAIDGIDALAKLEDFSPDIIITDVNMDNMDGLDFIDNITRKYPFIKIIILSGYDDFQYVQRALALKVYSYLMKPISQKELIRVVKNLISEIEADRGLREKVNSMETEIENSKTILVERFLFDLMYGNIESITELNARLEFLGISFNKPCYTCLLITVSEQYKIIRDYGMKKLQSFTFSIREIFINIMSKNKIWSLLGEYSNLTLLIGCDIENKDQFNEQLANDLEKALEYITILLGIKVTITVGGTYRSLLDISKSYSEAALAKEHNTISDKSNIIYINDVRAFSDSHSIYSAKNEKLLLKSFIDSDEDKIGEIIRDLFDEIETKKYTKEKIRIEIMGLLGMVSKKAMDMGMDIYELYDHILLDPYTALEIYKSRDEMENWFKNIVIKTIREIKDRQIFDIKNVIMKADEYLQENYANPDTSLITISEYLHLSSSYFSRIYKKETGENYVKALTRIRMNKARKLLKDTNEKIFNISEDTGYTDCKYFCTLFKKYFGYTPVEFREK